MWTQKGKSFKRGCDIKGFLVRYFSIDKGNVFLHCIEAEGFFKYANLTFKGSWYEEDHS